MTDLAIPPVTALPDVAAAAASLSLLLSLHPELAVHPFRWEVADGTVRPYIELDHPGTLQAVRALADAMELPLQTADWLGQGCVPHQTLRVEGRWAGADWSCIAYTRAGER